MDKIYNKETNESFSDYVQRMIENRKEYNLEYDELYEILFDDKLSNTESRKRMYGILKFIEAQEDINTDEQEKILQATNESFEMNGDGTQTVKTLISMCEEDKKNPNRIMELHGYDPLAWELSKSIQKKWNVYSKKDGINQLYSSAITVKPKDVQITKKHIDELFEDLKAKSKPLKSYKNSYKAGDCIIEIPMMDVHFGKLAWHGDVGTNYDMKICKVDYLNVINDFINRLQNKEAKIKKILFPIGQDFFNFDTINGETVNGTPQNNDGRWNKVFDKGVELLIKSIDMLREIAEIEVFYVPGNHDFTTSYYALKVIEAYFHQVPEVIVDNSPMARKYKSFGKCLIGYTHGNKEKRKIYKDNLMAKEEPKLWGETYFREWHLGHEHHEEVEEVGGFKVRKINSITSVDNWHYENGFVGSLRMAQAFLWHKDYGLLEIWNSPII